jgi:hypothetical protein
MSPDFSLLARVSLGTASRVAAKAGSPRREPWVEKDNNHTEVPEGRQEEGAVYNPAAARPKKQNLPWKTKAVVR